MLLILVCGKILLSKLLPSLQFCQLTHLFPSCTRCSLSLDIVFGCHSSLASFNLEYLPNFSLSFMTLKNFKDTMPPLFYRVFLILGLSHISPWLASSDAFAARILPRQCCSSWIIGLEAHDSQVPHIGDVNFDYLARCYSISPLYPYYSISNLWGNTQRPCRYLASPPSFP